MTNEQIAQEKCPHVVVPVSQAMGWPDRLDEFYTPGTKGGYYCSLCGCECILAPSGQQVNAMGTNPLLCMPCLLKLHDQKGA